jgi:hypothetical protein
MSSIVPSTSYETEKRGGYLSYPDIPRLLSLPHQSIKGMDVPASKSSSANNPRPTFIRECEDELQTSCKVTKPIFCSFKQPSLTLYT